VRLHLDGGGGGNLLGPAVSVGPAESGSHARSRPKTSGWQKSRVGEGQWLLLGFRARNAIWALRDIL
jgi:hypothetical protein